MNALVKLMPLEAWRQKQFTSPPCRETVRRWAANGDIPAIKIGKSWFVKVDELPAMENDHELD